MCKYQGLSGIKLDSNQDIATRKGLYGRRCNENERATDKFRKSSNSQKKSIREDPERDSSDIPASDTVHGWCLYR